MNLIVSETKTGNARDRSDMLVPQEMADKNHQRSDGTPAVQLADPACGAFLASAHRRHLCITRSLTVER